MSPNSLLPPRPPRPSLKPWLASLTSVRLGPAGPLATHSVPAWLPASLSRPLSSPAHWPSFPPAPPDANSGAIRECCLMPSRTVSE